MEGGLLLLLPVITFTEQRRVKRATPADLECEYMRWTWTYIILAVALVLFGVAGLFSIGVPFLLTGLVMLACFPWRRRRDVLWPSLASVWGFTVGYIIVAPLGCTTSGTGAAKELVIRASTTCKGVLFDYSGRPLYNPPLLPALLVGLAAGAAAALVVKSIFMRRSTSFVGPNGTADRKPGTPS